MYFVLIVGVFVHLTSDSSKALSVNIAWKKPATMSSVYSDKTPASNAVDGNTNSVYDKGSLMHTKENEASAWWRVDLQTQIESPLVMIYFRTDFTLRRNGVQVFTASVPLSTPWEGSLCHTVHDDGTGISDVLNTTCPGKWRYLTVYTNTSNDAQGPILDFAEVEVWLNHECNNGTYGIDCNNSCSSRPCVTSSLQCHPLTGQCAGGCQEGWMDPDCSQECTSDMFGQNCSLRCADRYCKGISNCPPNGTCTDGCQAGWQLDNCTQDFWLNMALNKPTEISSLLVNTSTGRLAVDGDTTGAYRAGVLMHTQLNQTSAWWKVDLQTQVESALVVLYFRTDYIARRNGLELFTHPEPLTDPTQGTLCHEVKGRPDGTDIPASLGVTCSGTWRYLTVYTQTGNDKGGPILDFAEVKVLVCTAGKYGPNCARDCSDRHCNRSSSSCERVTGACRGGCSDGWTGPDCSKVCDSGTYGHDCVGDCASRHCKTSSSTCDPISGECLSGGCREGWTGTNCSTKYGSTGDDKQADPVLSPGIYALVGAVAGVLVTLAVTGAVYLCLLRQGRLPMLKKFNYAKQVKGASHLQPRDLQGKNKGEHLGTDVYYNVVAAASNIPAGSAHTDTDRVCGGDYAGLDGTKFDNQNYDILDTKVYENA
ncbi:uncharacterized protein LOC124270853 [Haliotis rubra]|uniref:uncharacterized protein LOC124270853 n=1 Tax=Haliotis rubra TaxID=36100 RepID=UPI001EE5FD59|nr:uncharacterized protein LOC124270853 [Haliotis rubra]